MLRRDGARLVFIDDGLVGRTVNDHPVLSWEEFLREEGEKGVCLAIADGRVRQRLDDQRVAAGIALVSAQADNLVMMDDVQLGDGALLSPFVTLTSNIRIGRCFHANLYSYVEHDCVIGDYVTLAPRASVNGNVRLGDHVYVGTGALIRQGVNVGDGAVIGMGAVVTKDVAAHSTVIGNPARVMEPR